MVLMFFDVCRSFACIIGLYTTVMPDGQERVSDSVVLEMVVSHYVSA